MKLYDAVIAPNPRRVRWFMAEKGIEDIEIIQMNLMQGTHKTPDYLQKMGLANVPALEMDDGTTITESLAICRYLESVYPEPNLFGTTPAEVAVIEMWTRRAEMLVATPFMFAVRHLYPALAALETQNAEVGNYNAAAATRALKVLERQLADHPFIAGDRLTIADIVAFTGIDFTRMLKVKIPEDLTALTRWADHMRARPAAQAGMVRA